MGATTAGIDGRAQSTHGGSSLSCRALHSDGSASPPSCGGPLPPRCYPTCRAALRRHRWAWAAHRGLRWGSPTPSERPTRESKVGRIVLCPSIRVWIESDAYLFESGAIGALALLRQIHAPRTSSSLCAGKMEEALRVTRVGCCPGTRSESSPRRRRQRSAVWWTRV